MSRTYLLIAACSVLTVGCTTMSGHASDTPTASIMKGSAQTVPNDGGCGSVPGSSRWARTELYFGMQKPDKSYTTNEEYQQFIDEVVSPRFKDGFTVLDGRGQYLGPNGRLWREPTKVLVLMYPADSLSSTAIEEIRAAYKAAFHQESVMRVDGTTCVAF